MITPQSPVPIPMPAETPNPPPSGDIGELVERASLQAYEHSVWGHKQPWDKNTWARRAWIACMSDVLATALQSQAADLADLSSRYREVEADRERWMERAEKAEARIAELENELGEAREDARMRLAQRPYDEAYSRVEPIIRALLAAPIGDVEAATQTAANEVLEAAFRDTFDKDWRKLQARLSDAVKVIEEIAALDYTQAATNLCATKANRLARAFISTTGGDNG